MAYSKELIVGAFMHRFRTHPTLDINETDALEQMANEFYDKVGKDEFRKYASVTPEAIKEYKMFYE